MRLKNIRKSIDRYLILSFIFGLIPASFVIHFIQKDFSTFYLQAISFLKFHGFSYQIMTNYCDNPINSGLNARAPFVPLLMAISFTLFGRNMVGLYLPFLLARAAILPLTYLVARFYLPKRIAFLSAILLVIIPKLQTYAFGSPEADIFVALFYVLALFFYEKSDKLSRTPYALLSGLSLGFGALSKSIGLGIALGFILAVLFEQIHKLRDSRCIKRLSLFIFALCISCGPFLLWTLVVHHQLYLTTQNDKSLAYIATNLPSLIATIPNYLGLYFHLGLKGLFVSSIIVIFLILGIIHTIKSKRLTLTIPTIVTLILISTLSTCLLSGNITGSYEFITILGFTMVPASILLFDGAYLLIRLLWKLFFRRSVPHFIVTIVMLLIMFKFVNNFFTVRYALDYIPRQFYLTLPVILRHNEKLPDAEFDVQNGIRVFKGPAVQYELYRMFYEYRVVPFSKFYSGLIFSFMLVCMLVIIIPEKRIHRSS